MYSLPIYSEALREVVTTMDKSVTIFSVIWGNTVAQYMYLYL
jgi:hypothetical protein